MRRYETISILRSNLTEDEIDAINTKTAEIITGQNGFVINLDKWGLKKLAYLIQKEQQGYYVYTEYAGTPAAVDEMERIFKIDDRVLKYMTIKLQHEYVEDEPPQEEDIQEEDITVNATEAEADEIKTEDEAKTEAEAKTEE